MEGDFREGERASISNEWVYALSTRHHQLLVWHHPHAL
jgi:hypothetical protein